MRVKHKTALFELSFFACLLLACLLWLSLRTVEIVAVHENGNHSYFLVKNFPFKNKARIHWWQQNNALLKKNYNTHQPDTDGFFTVIFWDFGDGYKEENHDRLCFEDMDPPKNCIEKNKVLTVSNGRNRGFTFITHDEIYRMRKNGNIVEDEAD